MGTSSGVDQFVGKIRKAGADIQKAQKQAVTEAGKIMQKGATDAMNAATSGSAHLRNVKNSKLSVSVKIAGTGSETTATVKAVGGPYAILDNPTPGHWLGMGRTRKVKGGIGPRIQVKGRTGTSAKGKLGTVEFGPGIGGREVLRIVGREVEGPVYHPGTKGKRTFKIGTAAVQPAVVARLEKVNVDAVRAVFV